VITPFVGIDFLEEHRDEVVVADVRYYLDGRSGKSAYKAGHIPGAIFVDLDWRLTDHDATGGGRHPLPSPAFFQAMLAELGIDDGDTVIAYDDAGGIMAARLVWMLRATGRDAAILDGGIQAWPHPLSTKPVDRSDAIPAFPEERPWPADRLASIEDAAGAPQREVPLIDARPRERFDGAPDNLDPRAGHIPGARSVPCRENLGPDGRLKPVAELREAFAAAGVTGDGEQEVISYCGSGVTSCHNLLVMEQAGLGVWRLFPGSWSQWSREPGRPAEVTSKV
jgi:thiosulfate/3-mercaptopyruvate sulfurtransferase